MINTNLENLQREEDRESVLIACEVPAISFEDKMVNLFSNLVGDNKKHQKILGVVLMASAGLFLTLGNSLVQYVFENNEKEISSFQILFIRSLVQASFTILFMIHGKVHPYGEKKRNLLLLFIMGFVESGAIVLIYLSLQRIPVGDATVIQFTAPMFTMLFSLIILKICCSWTELVFGLFSFVGVVFIAKPEIIEGNHRKVSQHFHHSHNIAAGAINGTNTHKMELFTQDYVVGALFALLGAMCLAMFYILNKLNGKKHDVTLTIFYPSIVGIVISPIVMAIRNESWLIHEITIENWVILVTVGFIAFIGMMFMAESLQLENPGPAVLIRNLDVVYAFLMQYLLMHHLPGISSLIGTVIILSCSTIIVLSRVFNWEEKICGRKKICGYRPIEEDTDGGEEFLLKQSTVDEEALNE